MTEHAEYVGLILRAADGALTSSEQGTLTAHLESCADCRQALDTQVIVRRALAARPAAGAPVDFGRRVRIAIDAEMPAWARTRVDFRRWTLRLLPVAAALACLTFGLTHRDGTPASSSTIASVSQDTRVSGALWSDSISDTGVLSLMLKAHADDVLTNNSEGVR